MSIYTPTWLYIKQHNQTGLKYFGKTIHDPYTYSGSGKYWKRHLTKHGNDVTTIWCQLFVDKESLTEYALTFSCDNNIVESTIWANLKPESGLDGGGIVGRKQSTETKEKIGMKARGRKMSAEFCELRSKLQKGKTPWNKGKVGVQPSPNKGKGGESYHWYGMKHSDASRAKMRKPKEKVECPHCHLIGGIGTMHRWHFDHCKLAPDKGSE